MRLRVGDKIVISKPTDEELECISWKFQWLDSMDALIGKVAKARVVNVEYVQLTDTPFSWPHQALAKVQTIQLDFSEYKYIAQDRDGEIYFYTEEPPLGSNSWDAEEMEDYPDYLPFFPTPDLGEDWKNSLHKILPDGTLIPVRKTHTINIDGKEITISEESLNSIKKQLGE